MSSRGSRGFQLKNEQPSCSTLIISVKFAPASGNSTVNSVKSVVSVSAGSKKGFRHLTPNFLFRPRQL